MSARIVFLCSGGGGNLRFLHACMERGWLSGAELSGVLADRDCGALRYASSQGLPNALVPYHREDRDALRARLDGLKPDWVITTIHKILDPVLVSAYRGRLINSHYSLLPLFPGLIGDETVRRALQSGCRFVGTTIHLVEEAVDAGPILAQSVVRVSEGEAFPALMERVFRSACLNLLNVFLDPARTSLRWSGPSARSQDNWDEAFFSPALRFPPDAFDEAFWETLR